MPTHSQDTPRPLPDRRDLRHLKNQAKDLFRAGDARSLTDAQFKIARLYGFASWPKLKAHVDSLEEIGQLKQAIDSNKSEEHTSELQSRFDLVCRLLLEKKKLTGGCRCHPTERWAEPVPYARCG